MKSILRHVPSLTKFLSLSLVLLFASSAVAKTEFVDVPRSCEQTLRKLGPEDKTLNKVVDWSELHEHLLQIGYNDEIAAEKLEGANWDSDRVESVLKQVRKHVRRNWKWGDVWRDANLSALARGLVEDDDSLTNLPMWASLKDFDVPKFVHYFLNAQSNSGSFYGYELNKNLARFAPLWLSGPLRGENALDFFKIEKDLDTLSWLLPFLTRKDQRALIAYAMRQQNFVDKDFERHGESLTGNADETLALLSTFPWSSFNRKWKDFFNNWVDLEAYKPLKLDSIRHIQTGYEDAGNCENMSQGHMRTLGLTVCKGIQDKGDVEDIDQSVLISVDGHLIGSLKSVGDPSMLALRNVMDSTGRLVLVMGATYHIAKDTFDSAQIANKRRAHEDGKVGRRRVNLKSLNVHPNTMLFNADAWGSSESYNMIFAAREYMDTEDFLRVIKAMSEGYGDGNIESIANELHHTVWFGLLNALEQRREELE